MSKAVHTPTTSRRGLLFSIAAAAPMMALPALAAPAAGPDAELIALCARYPADRDAANGSSDDPGALDPGELWDRYYETYDAIGEAEPQTVAGVVAKARAALEAAKELDGTTINFSGSGGEAWAYELVLDLVRLADAGVLS